MPYRVLIVDDQSMPRQLFESFVAAAPDRYELAASVDSAKVAYAWCARGRVDLILMDVVMKDGYSGLEAAERIKASYPEIRIIIVTSMPEVSYIERAKALGADSFWYKELDSEPLLSVMDRTMEGEHVYPDSVPSVRIGLTSSRDLTASELSVLREVARGSSNEEIARALSISTATVKTHINHMMQKTGFHNRTELAIEARVSGIVIPD